MKKLGEIGEIVNGLTYSPNDIVEDGVLVLRSSNVQNRNLAFEDNVYVRTDNYNPVQENDILICVRNGSKNLIGKNALINKENEGVAFGAFMSIYRSSFNKFLFHWFDTNEYKEIVHKNLGATINSINGSDLREFKVPFPSVAEQTKLTSFLSLVDERMQTQNKIIKELNVLKTILAKRVFSQELKFKDGNGNSFSDWDTKKVGQVYSFKTTNSLSRDKLIYQNGDVKNIHYGDIHTKFQTLFDITREEVPYIINSVSLEKVSQENYLKVSDMIFADASEDLNDVGKSIEIKNLNNQKVLSGLHTILARPQSGVFSLGFGGYLFKSPQVRIQIKKEAQGSKVLSISSSRLSNVKILIPKLEEQAKIANFLSSIDSKIDIETKLLEKIEEQKKFLLRQMFV